MPHLSVLLGLLFITFGDPKKSSQLEYGMFIPPKEAKALPISLKRAPV